MHCVLTHLGHILLLKLKQLKSENNEPITIVSVELYKLSLHVKSFITVGNTQSYLKGHWEIATHAIVDCDLTGKLEPVFLLFSNSNNIAMNFELYQLENLKQLVKVFHFHDQNVVDRSKFLKTCHVFVCGGPSIVMINFSNQEILQRKLVQNNLVTLTSSLKDLHSIFSFESDYESNKFKCKFLSQIVDVDKSLCDKSSYINSSSTKWISVSFSSDFVANKIEISYQDCSILPCAYCPIATQVIFEQESSSHLILTSRCQLITIKQKKILKVCDVPLTNCNHVNIVGDREYQVAVVIDKHDKCSCAINLQTLEVLKIWDNINYYTSGRFAVEDTVSNYIVLLQNDFKKDNIQPEEFVIFSSLKDLTLAQQESFEHFKLKSSSPPLVDVECDLFSSPDSPVEGSDEELKILKKVVNTLKFSVDKHRTAIDGLRQQLGHFDSAIKTSCDAVREMNNNVNILKSNPSDDRNHPMLDLFYSLSKQNNCKESLNRDEVILKLIKFWQYVISDRWILGFELNNISQRYLSRFGVVLSKQFKSAFSTPINSSQSKFFRHVPPPSNPNSLPSSSNFSSFDQNSSGDSSSSVLSPGETFTLTTSLDLHSFSNPSESSRSFPVAVLACVSNTSESNVEATLENFFVFQAGHASLSSVEIASQQLSVKIDNLNHQNTDVCRETIFAIKAYHETEKTYSFSSHHTDVAALCREVFRVIGFHLYTNVYINTNTGPFHVMMVYFVSMSCSHCDVTISSKSEYEINLLLTYIKEQVCNVLEIKDKD